MLASNINVAFRGLEHSDAVEARVHEEAAKLDRIFDHLTSGTVTIELPHRHEGSSAHYCVHIRLAMPGAGEIIISHQPGDMRKHDDVYRALHDAFAVARRRLKERIGKMKDRGRFPREDLAETLVKPAEG